MRIIPIVALILGLAAPALAVPCKTHGSADAKLIAELPAASDTEFYRALAEATQPKALAAAQKTFGCTRLDKTLSGENAGSFPRVYRKETSTGFLAPVPVLREGKKTTVYAIVWVWGSGAVRIAGLLDGVPEDKQARSLLTPDKDGGFDPLTFSEATGQLVDVNAYLAPQVKTFAAQNLGCMLTGDCL